ncbi:hypothetical protein FG386_000917 [Cryptosporidium ryanae]|uniref:uncharacterized protein n=1 Tax=Cryptosporidium ryanae TaxID=515981 RepID=UPI003519F838|nr:hypothetical protein FG386_000917 [Cryptosporidium ryanae]
MPKKDRELVELIKKIDDFHYKIDTGIIKLKVEILNYLEEPLFNYLKNTRNQVDELYNETRMYCYSYYNAFNPRYISDEEMINRYAVSKMLEIKAEKLMIETNLMLELESKRKKEVILKINSLYN